YRRDALLRSLDLLFARSVPPRHLHSFPTRRSSDLRYIVGYSASENLLTENTTIPALRMALGRRKVEPGLILHSDGGGQYYCKEVRELTTHHQIRNSMGKTAYENPNAERVNGTIKNSYLRHYYPQNFRELKNELARAVRNYNKRPHQSLNRISPKQFDKQYTRASS